MQLHRGEDTTEENPATRHIRFLAVPVLAVQRYPLSLLFDRVLQVGIAQESYAGESRTTARDPASRLGFCAPVPPSPTTADFVDPRAESRA